MLVAALPPGRAVPAGDCTDRSRTGYFIARETLRFTNFVFAFYRASSARFWRAACPVRTLVAGTVFRVTGTATVGEGDLPAVPCAVRARAPPCPRRSRRPAS
jgi:hypothetical protein